MNTNRSKIRIASILIQLILLCGVMQRYQPDQPALFHLLLLFTIGFPIYSLAPENRKMPVFAALSAAGIFLVLGLKSILWFALAGVPPALLLLSRLNLTAKITGFGLWLAALAFLRTLPLESLPGPLYAVLPILGSIFMFRPFLHLYEQYSGAPRALDPRQRVQNWTYFFMAPNICAPFFPVVDHRTWMDCRDPAGDLSVAQRGVFRIYSGWIQLLVARAVHAHVFIVPTSVHSTTDLVRYLTADYLLYFRISGLFDLCIGSLMLFGFNLPETNRTFFLSKNISEFWRRVNIYWKDFMVKTVHYPVYMSLRKSGERRALAVATLLVFIVSGILHSWQWFWIRGEFSFKLTDALLWGVFGLWVLGHQWWSSMFPESRASGPAWLRTLRDGFGILITFAFMSVLFSIWSSGSLSLWINTVTFGAISRATVDGWLHGL